jgi:hypothetical protein
MAMKALIAALLLATATAAGAKPLTVRIGESWAFRIKGGEPVQPRKVASTAKPAKGEIMVTARSFLGTMLTAVNGTGRGWTFKAELLSGGKASPARTCTLPSSTIPTMEQWKTKSDAVRISKFVPADGGSC